MQRLIFDGPPVPWQRAGNQRGRIYDTDRNREMKRAIGLLWRQLNTTPYAKDVPIRLILRFAFKRPLSHFVGRRRTAELRDDAPRHHVQKPDGDNLAKLIKDALKECAWHDDAQVVELHVAKVWVRDDPYTEILVDTVT